MISVWLSLALAFALVTAAIGVLLLGRSGASRARRSRDAGRGASRGAEPPSDDGAP